MRKQKDEQKGSTRQEDLGQKRKYFKYMTATQATEKDKGIEHKELAKSRASEDSIKKFE